MTTVRNSKMRYLLLLPALTNCHETQAGRSLLKTERDLQYERQVAIGRAAESTRVPSPELVALVEIALSKHHAVDGIIKFDRRYAFSIGAVGLDPNRIDFSLRLPPRKKIAAVEAVPAVQLIELDDGQFYHVDGHYDIARHTLHVEDCSMNHPLSEPGCASAPQQVSLKR